MKACWPWLCLAGLWWSGHAATAQEGPPTTPVFLRAKADPIHVGRAVARVPLEQIAADVRGNVQFVLDKANFYTQGPLESFVGKPEQYVWALEHPDQACLLWRRLGAVCLDITGRGPGQFAWSDNQGSEVTWQLVFANPTMHVWYADGQVKPGALLPMVPLRCVMVMRHGIVRQQGTAGLLQQQADIFIQTDSKTAVVVTRMLGPSAARMAEQGATQIQLFFSALVWRLHLEAERAAQRPTPTLPPQTQPPNLPETTPVILRSSYKG